jgi:hypothetical protein
MPCKKCRDLSAVFPIDHPDDLRRELRKAKINVKNKIILQDMTVNIPFDIPLDEVEPDGMWDDSMSFHFRCTKCGQLFRLYAETYHGRGGSWEPVEHAPPPPPKSAVARGMRNLLIMFENILYTIKRKKCL